MPIKMPYARNHCIRVVKQSHRWQLYPAARPLAAEQALQAAVHRIEDGAHHRRRVVVAHHADAQQRLDAVVGGQREVRQVDLELASNWHKIMTYYLVVTIQ